MSKKQQHIGYFKPTSHLASYVRKDQLEELKSYINESNLSVDKIFISNQLTPLYSYAIRRNATQIINEFDKENSAALDAVDKFKNTALHYCAAFNADRIAPLVKLGKDINALNFQKVTPAYYAATLLNLKALKQLKECNADFTIKNHHKNNLLHAAVKSEKKDSPKKEVVEFIIQENPEMLFDYNKDNKSPLEFAYRNKENTIMEILAIGMRDYFKTNENSTVEKLNLVINHAKALSLKTDSNPNLIRTNMILDDIIEKHSSNFNYSKLSKGNCEYVEKILLIQKIRLEKEQNDHFPEPELPTLGKRPKLESTETPEAKCQKTELLQSPALPLSGETYGIEEVDYRDVDEDGTLYIVD